MTVGVGPQAGVCELVGDLEGLVQIGLRSCEVSGRRLQPAGDEQTRRSGLPRERVRGGERTAEAFGTGDTVAEDDPRPSEAHGDAATEQRVVGRGPGEGDVDVRPLRPDGRDRLGLARAADGGRAPVRAGSRTTWRAPPRRCRAAPTRAGGRAHTRGCCRAAGSERTRPARPRRSRGSGRPGARRRRPLTSRGRRAGQDHLGGLEGRSAGEARQCPQAPLVVGEQQVVAPRDRRGEGSTPLGPPAGRIPQQGEAVVEPSRRSPEPTAT